MWNPFFPGFSASTCFLQPIDIFYCIAEGSKTTWRNTLYKSFLSPYLGDECLFFFHLALSFSSQAFQLRVAFCNLLLIFYCIAEGFKDNMKKYAVQKLSIPISEWWVPSFCSPCKSSFWWDSASQLHSNFMYFDHITLTQLKTSTGESGSDFNSCNSIRDLKLWEFGSL